MITRDISNRLQDDKGSLIQIIIGPRQCGKSTLLLHISGDEFDDLTFDDLQMRRLADKDPGLFLTQFKPPLIVDEVQYAPNLFPELKRIVDQRKRDYLLADAPIERKVLFRLTGSNQILLDKNVKETLVGRASYYYLNTLSVHEVLSAYPDFHLNTLLYQGGYPELYINADINPTNYLNDYIRNYIEKDIVLSAGIEKQQEFNTVLGMLAARTGGFINYSAIARDSGVKSATVKEWVSILQRSSLVYLLPPCEPNLNKRLVKMPKLYFLDTGLAVRLQGWTAADPFFKSPQVGAMFETLVLAEIIKFMHNYGHDWKLSVWRTKEGHKIDFVIDTGNNHVFALDAKLGVHGVKAETLPSSFRMAYPEVDELVLVTLGGAKMKLGQHCLQCPIGGLVDYLLGI